MSASQRVLFTALPNGPVPGFHGRYALSVHVSPRLTTDGDPHLTAFQDWVDWPATVAEIGWKVAFGNAAPVAAAVVSPAPRSDLWKALFAGNTTVRAHGTRPYFHDRKVRSYPARNIREFIRARYTDAAVNSPSEHPGFQKLLADLSPVDPNVFGGSVGAGAVETQLAKEKVVVNGDPLTQPAQDFYQLARFHRPRVATAARLATPVAKPVLDFHQAVGTVGQYPPLLRLLGLVVDLTVDLDGALPASPSEVRVVPAWVPAAANPTTVVGVRTRCIIDGAQFRARPRDVTPAELVDGKLPLEDTERFTVVQEDLDGAASKLIDLAGNLGRLQSNGRSSASPEAYALPSLRSGGLAVARTNRAGEFHDRQGRQTVASKQADADALVVVDAEDVTRGYRVDIRDTREGRWFSLGARTGTYAFVKTGASVPFTDESWVTAAPTEDEAGDLYLQETLFRWGGWSLAAPRPGGRLATTQAADPPVTTDPGAPGPDFPVRIDTRPAPGSLPRLRFGRRYEVRARAVDLAGNSPPLDPGNRDPHASPPVDYARFEPVQTPPVLPFAPRTAGETLERVVLRSNWDADPDPGLVIARHLVPPKAAQLLAEQHGLFDTAYPGSVLDTAAYSTITKYPALTPPPGPVVISEQGDFMLSAQGVNDPADHKKTRYFPVDLVSLPYLPDPLARGAVLRFLDGPHAGLSVKAEFAAEPSWPNHRPVRLVVRQAGGPSLPTYDPTTHQVDVPLGKADVVRVRLSAYLDRADLDKLGIWAWIVDGGGAALAPQVVDGGHWMVTPHRVLTLVHAVRQPLAMAQFPLGDGSPDFQATRGPGETVATFTGSLTYSRKSTSRIDMVANWTEFVDRGPGTAAPTQQARQALPFSVHGDRPPLQQGIVDQIPFVPLTDRQEFGDTKHRTVAYSTVATTRFAEYFTRRKTVTVAYGGATMVVVDLDTGGKGVVPGSVSVKNHTKTDADGRVSGAGTYADPAAFRVDAVAGKVTILAGGTGHVPNNTKIVISYLVPPHVRPGPGEAMTPAQLNILSTARPAAPKVLYVVPTFGWETQKRPFDTFESRRLGRGLRVYLQRPWWSSGAGELLGVVLAPGPITPALAPFVTRWGADPVFRSTETDTPNPLLPDFPDTVRAQVGLSAPGVDGDLAVLGHEVGYDDDRGLWYCDIRVDTRSYFPFVRLALARYQPESLPGAHLSPVVLTDFVQLTPDRTASVTPASPTRVHVTVAGQSYDRAGNSDTRALVRVTVQERDPRVSGDLAWVNTPQAAVLSPQPPSGSISVWSGEISVKAADNPRQRLLIEEFERHRLGSTPAVGERLVYVDTIELDADPVIGTTP